MGKGKYSAIALREYCRTFKIGAYIANNHFGCSSVRYSSLRELLEFCIANEIAPIINHKSFKNKFSGHFSVVKNISENFVIINDPENKNMVSVSLPKLDEMARKSNSNDEVGGNTAIIPILDKFPYQTRSCPSCGNDINMSFSYAANAKRRIVEEDLCQNCDVFSPTL